MLTWWCSYALLINTTTTTTNNNNHHNNNINNNIIVIIIIIIIFIIIIIIIVIIIIIIIIIQRATILWDMPIQTDKEIKANRPDIVMKDKKERTSLLIDMSIPTERNTSLITVEKLTRYKGLEIEIEKTWRIKTTTVPVIIGALGLVKKGTENYIGKIAGNITITELEKKLSP